MSDAEPTEEESVEAIYAFAADQMENETSGQQIESMLVEKGLDQASASTVVSNLSRMQSEAIRSAGAKNMLWGAVWCIGGIMVTAFTYSAAVGGGTYVVAWGAILFGGI